MWCAVQSCGTESFHRPPCRMVEATQRTALLKAAVTHLCDSKAKSKFIKKKIEIGFIEVPWMSVSLWSPVFSPKDVGIRGAHCLARGRGVPGGRISSPGGLWVAPANHKLRSVPCPTDWPV